MGEETRARLRRNVREPYTWLITAMAVLYVVLHGTGHPHLALVMLVMEAVTFAVNEWTRPPAKGQD